MASSTTRTAPPVITAVEADAYMATTMRNAAWLAIPAGERDVLLLEAQRWLNGLCPNPDAEGCCGDFAAQWTAAVSELALALKLSPTAVISGAAAAGATGEVKRQKLGDLEVEFFQAVSGAGGSTRRYGPKAPYILQAFPWLTDLLSPCWLPGVGGRVIPVERN